VDRDAGLDDLQIGVTMGAIYVQHTARVYHGLSRMPVVTVAKHWEEFDGDGYWTAEVGEVNTSYFEIRHRGMGGETVYYTYV
jgi:hypothetical protein